MKLAFAGTPEFAATVLAALLHAGHRVAAVYTQPDRPAGRGRRLAPSPVKTLALSHGLAVRQPASLRGEGEREALAALGTEALVVAAYGLILPPSVLDVPVHGCVNVHASLLPRWRGAAPIQRAILAGDPVTGVSIMRMDAGLDTGPVFAAREIAIGERETAGELHDRLAALGAAALLEVLDALARGEADATPQPAQGATYAARLDKAEARLDWSRDAATLDRQIRAFNPVPIAWTTLPERDARPGERLRVLAARPAAAPAGTAPPGEVMLVGGDTLRVACGHGAMDLLQVQAAGRRAVSAAEFNRAGTLRAGDRLA